MDCDDTEYYLLVFLVNRKGDGKVVEDLKHIGYIHAVSTCYFHSINTKYKRCPILKILTHGKASTYKSSLYLPYLPKVGRYSIQIPCTRPSNYNTSL